MKQLNGWWSSDLSPHLEISTLDGVSLDLVVDSGFNQEITLPAPLIEQLGLLELGKVENELADGSMVWVKAYAGEILWFGKRKPVWVQATDSTEGLLGTELFRGCLVELDPDEQLVRFTKKTTRKQRR